MPGEGTMLVQRTPEEERGLLHSDSNGYTNLPDVVQPSHSPTEAKSSNGSSSPSKDSATDYQSRGLVKAPGKSSFTMFVDLGIYQSSGGSGDTIPITAFDPSRLEQLQLEARKGSVVNVNPTNTRPHSDTPEIRKYKKRFNSEILCAALWGVNLLVGTENGLMLLDRSGQGKVYSLINRRRFQQMDVLEGLNLLTTISGKRNKLRVYYLSWLRNKILHNDPEVEKKQGWTTVGDMEGCVHYRVVYSGRIKFLVIALKNSVEVYAWAPKPYHKFMAFKEMENWVPIGQGDRQGLLLGGHLVVHPSGLLAIFLWVYPHIVPDDPFLCAGMDRWTAASPAKRAVVAVGGASPWLSPTLAAGSVTPMLEYLDCPSTR
uniref:Misshapen-like kinase 1 n=1 Tax=Sphaerodactylus townsendi TaxID=933632 RepID=A0ACB8EXD2_9SAUR